MPAPSYTAADYLGALQSLLPRGRVWPREGDAIQTKALTGLSETFARHHARSNALLGDAFPATALELLPEWEKTFGLPDTCTAGIATTLQERRSAVVTKLTARGGQSIAYYTAIAAALGYSVSIRQFRPFVCGTSQCGDQLNGAATVRHTWAVTVNGPRVTYFRTGISQAGDKLGKITHAEDLECLLARLKPAHTDLIFSYIGA